MPPCVVGGDKVVIESAGADLGLADAELGTRLGGNADAANGLSRHRHGRLRPGAWRRRSPLPRGLSPAPTRPRARRGHDRRRPRAPPAARGPRRPPRRANPRPRVASRCRRGSTPKTRSGGSRRRRVTLRACASEPGRGSGSMPPSPRATSSSPAGRRWWRKRWRGARPVTPPGSGCGAPSTRRRW